MNKTRSTQQEPQNNISLPNSWPRQSRNVKKNNLNAAILFRLILIPLATAWPFLENNQTCSKQEFKNGEKDICPIVCINDYGFRRKSMHLNFFLCGEEPSTTLPNYRSIELNASPELWPLRSCQHRLCAAQVTKRLLTSEEQQLPQGHGHDSFNFNWILCLNPLNSSPFYKIMAFSMGIFQNMLLNGEKIFFYFSTPTQVCSEKTTMHLIRNEKISSYFLGSRHWPSLGYWPRAAGDTALYQGPPRSWCHSSLNKHVGVRDQSARL